MAISGCPRNQKKEKKKMINKIKVVPETQTSNILFFDETDLNLLPDKRIVPLFGANGSGKTTLLKAIENSIYSKIFEKQYKDMEPIELAMKGIRKPKSNDVSLDIDDAPTALFTYRNSTDNFRVKEPKSYFDSFDPTYLNLKYDANALSEGQSIVYSAMDLLKGMLKSTKTKESFVNDDQHAIVLIDELDSGLSIDNIEDAMKVIKRVLRQKRNIQFFMSFNNPFMCHFFPNVISMYDGQVHQIHNTEEMYEELKKNQEMLKKSRKKRNGKFRIFD